MKRVILLSMVFALASAAGRGLSAQERDFCVDGPGVNCTDDTLEVVFPLVTATDLSVWEYAEFVADTPIDAEVVIDAVNPDIQGWSYGVAHDSAALAIVEDSVTTDGTVVEDIFSGGFNVTTAVDGGFVSAVIPSLVEDIMLPVGRQAVCRASYRLIADVGTEGTLLRLADQELSPPDSPATDINITRDGLAYQPRKLYDGVIRKYEADVEICDNGVDDDLDSLVDLDDPDCQTCPCDVTGPCPDFAYYFGDDVAVETVELGGGAQFAISSRNASPLLGFQLGVTTREGGGQVFFRFSSELGTDELRIVELLMTDAVGASVTPEVGNQLTAATMTVESIARGAAIAAFDGEDFLEYDMAPGVGGPGFFVGYVSDSDGDVNQVPATPAGDETSCPLNELLVVTLGTGPVECPDYALYMGGAATEDTVDVRGLSSLAITSRNLAPLLGFQFGVKTTDGAEGTEYTFTSDIGTDEDRLVEVLMTDATGRSIAPVTPNAALASSGTVTSIVRGAALAGFEGTDFFEYDLDPGVGGPGFFVGYVSDLDDDVQQIPATAPGGGGECPLNELLIVGFDGEVVCEDYGLYFGGAATASTVDATTSDRFVISSTNAAPLLAVQLGVSVQPEGDDYRYMFSSDLGTDDSRVVELLMTDVDGLSIAPVAVNDLLASAPGIGAVERGAAIVAFDGEDFLEYDVEPGVGGSGFFVGYVSDLASDDNQIPATAGGESCPLNELFVVTFEGTQVCVDNGFYFGDRPTGDTVDATGAEQFVISGRNANALLAFQLGVAVSEEADAYRYRFSGGLGTDDDRLVELLMTDADGLSIDPQAVNELVSDVGSVASVARGSAIAAFEGEDFLEYDTAPGVGGPGFFVGYVSDLASDVNQIPATPDGAACALNELLIVTLGEGGDQPFQRGDADGNGRINVSDPVWIIQVVVGNFTPLFDCEDAFDANNDEAVDISDALPILAWLFLQGPGLDEPFLTCGEDPEGPDSALGCRESNCVEP